MSRLRISHLWVWQNGAWVQNSEKRRVYLGMDVVQERDVNNVVTASYSGGLLARSTASGTVFYGFDGNESVTSLTDETGAVVGSYTYDAWGNVVNLSGPKAQENPYRYSGKEQLAGYYSYGYRFYNSGLGKWINRDPLREDGGANIYAFVGGDPMDHIDFYGLDWVNGVSDFAAGAGDTLSFGATIPIRKAIGVDDVVDKGSGAYLGGVVSGTALALAIAPEDAAGGGAEAIALRQGIKATVVNVGKHAVEGAVGGAAGGAVSAVGGQIANSQNGKGFDGKAVVNGAIGGAIAGAASGAISSQIPPLSSTIATTAGGATVGGVSSYVGNSVGFATNNSDIAPPTIVYIPRNPKKPKGCP